MYCASLFSDKGWKAKYCFQLLWRWTPARCLNHSLFSGHMLSGNLTCFLLQWTTMKTTPLWYLYDLLKLTGKQCQQFRLLSLLHYLLNWVKLDNDLRIKYRWDPIMIIVWHLLNLDCQVKAKIWINFCPSPKSQIKPVVCVVNSLEFWGKKYFLLAVKKITHSLILTQSFASNEMNL